MSSCHNCTIAHLKKWPTRCQQGVNKVSTRCQICNHLPRKKCKSSYLSFVCRQKIIFVFVFAFVICFLEGGTRSKKKWYFGKMEGGGGNKMRVLIRDQSWGYFETHLLGDGETEKQMCLPSRQIVFYIDAILPSAYCSLRRSRLCCPLAPNECTLLDPAPAPDLLFSSAADKCVQAWQDNLKRFTGS